MVPAWLRYAREFSAKRRVVGDQKTMNRLYVAEPNPTATGSKADHRFPMRASDVEALCVRAGRRSWAWAGMAAGSNPQFTRWVTAIARDLQTNKGASIIIPGDHQTAGGARLWRTP